MVHSIFPTEHCHHLLILQNQIHRQEERQASFETCVCSVESLGVCHFLSKGSTGSKRAQIRVWTYEHGITEYDLAVESVLLVLPAVLSPSSKWRKPCVSAVVGLKCSPSLAMQWLPHTSLRCVAVGCSSVLRIHEISPCVSTSK